MLFLFKDGKSKIGSPIIKNEFVSADYSQIELRVLAHFSEDPNLKNAFIKGEDIHNFTAATMYECDLTKVNDEMRRIAKILNFGVLYILLDHLWWLYNYAQDLTNLILMPILNL